MSTMSHQSPRATTKAEHDLFALRIYGGGLDGRVVRLTSSKCTVGSGPRCTLRFVGPGIRPLHCLIVRGARGTFVRRWSPNTLLNGRSFEDAMLAGGDRLSIGPIELEVLDDEIERVSGVSEAELTACAVPPAVAHGPSGAASSTAGVGTAALRTGAQPSEEIRRQVAGLRSRTRNLADSLRESRRQQEDLEARVNASLQAQQKAEAQLSQVTSEARVADKLQERVSSLAEALEVHKEREQALVTQLQESREREAALQRDIQAMSSEHTRRDAVIESRLADLERQREEIERLRSELEATRERIVAGQGDRPPHETEPGQGAAHSEEPPSEGGLPEAETGASHAPAEHREGATEETDAQLANGRPPCTSAPESFLKKYVAHLLDDEDTSDPMPDSLPSEDETDDPLHLAVGPADGFAETAEESAGAAPPYEASPASDEDDESLEEYMAKLMQRVCGDEATGRLFAAGPHRRGPATHEEVRSSDPLAKEDDPSGTFRWENMKRRAAPPERPADLAAMRELANQSAHSAISRYGNRRRLRDAVGKFIAGGICLGSGLATLSLAPEWPSAAMVGGAASLLVAAYFGLHGMLRVLAVMRDRKSTLQGRSKDHYGAGNAVGGATPREAMPTASLAGDGSEADGLDVAKAGVEEEVRSLTKK